MDGSDLMLLGVLVVAVPFALLVLLGLGPLGWIILGALVFALGITVSLRESPDEESIAASGWNCRDCGARNDGDADACHYCGTARGAGSSEDRRVDW